MDEVLRVQPKDLHRLGAAYAERAPAAAAPIGPLTRAAAGVRTGDQALDAEVREAVSAIGALLDAARRILGDTAEVLGTLAGDYAAADADAADGYLSLSGTARGGPGVTAHETPVADAFAPPAEATVTGRG